jgi:hypothetical protein
MKAVVVDKEMDCLKEHFVHCHPSLGVCCDIEYLGFDVRDKELFKLLNDLSHIDYVVLALSDSEVSKQVALDIKLHYERENLSALPFVAVYDKDGIAFDERCGGKIFTFGCREAIYKDSVVIRAKTDRLAKAVHSTYVDMYGGQPWFALDWFLQESNRAAADFIPAMLKLAGLSRDEALG